jgi:hypothetical protein
MHRLPRYARPLSLPLAVLLLAACGPATIAPAAPTTPPTATAAPIVAAKSATTITISATTITISATSLAASAATASPFAGAPSPGASPTPLVGPRTITPADQGQTLRLAVGETFTLRLGDAAWEVQITDPRVLAPVQATPGPGEQGSYQARATGVSELLAVAEPPCAKAQPPCRILAPAFRLLVVVR